MSTTGTEKDLISILVRKDIEFGGNYEDTKYPPEEYLSRLISNNLSELPKITDGIPCPRCHEKSAFKTIVQFRASDEAGEILLRCTNPECRYVLKTQ